MEITVGIKTFNWWNMLGSIKKVSYMLGAFSVSKLFEKLCMLVNGFM